MRKKLQLFLEAVKSKRVVIRCFGDEAAYDIWRKFNSRHPKLPLFRLKTIGACLQSIPLDANELMAGSHFTLMRRKVRKAQKAGFTYRQIDPFEHFDAIMRINRSAGARQGQKMTDEYLDAAVAAENMKIPGEWFGVFDAGGVLQAYSHTPVFGDAFTFWKILGHTDFLEDGVVYLLVYETMRYMSERRRRDGFPVWGMYDMYVGGADGLREFKRRTGFLPYRVKWQWVDTPHRRP